MDFCSHYGKFVILFFYGFSLLFFLVVYHRFNVLLLIDPIVNGLYLIASTTMLQASLSVILNLVADSLESAHNYS